MQSPLFWKLITELGTFKRFSELAAMAKDIESMVNYKCKLAVKKLDNHWFIIFYLDLKIGLILALKDKNTHLNAVKWVCEVGLMLQFYQGVFFSHSGSKPEQASANLR